MYAHLPLENADTVSLVCALLVRFPEVASLRALPSDGTVALTFAIKGRLDKAAQAALAETVADHVGGFLMLAKDEATTLNLEVESDRAMAFVHLTRDLDTFTKEELEMLVAFFAQRFGDGLVRNPVPDQLAYSLSKQALHASLRNLARELAPRVRVNGVAPGLVLPSADYDDAQWQRLRAMMPLNRLPRPEDVAAAVVWLARAPAVTGQTVFVDAGANLESYPRDFVYLARE